MKIDDQRSARPTLTFGDLEPGDVFDFVDNPHGPCIKDDEGSYMEASDGVRWLSDEVAYDTPVIRLNATLVIHGEA